MLSPETLQANPEITGRTLAEVACSYFIQASITCPASTVAQGAHIALLARESRHLPLGLSEALLGDEALLLGIKRAAEKKHNRGPKTVALERVKEIVKADFDYADLLSLLPDEDLRTITTEIYFRINQVQGLKFANDLIWEEAESLLRGRRAA